MRGLSSCSARSASPDRAPQRWEGFRTGRSTRSPPSGDPEPRRRGRPDRQGRADRARRRYALLRPGDGTEFFVAGHLAGLLAERRTQRMIDATSDHYIICGFGRVGRQVARDLRAAGARYVVIDARPREPRAAAEASACASSRARRPATRSCAAPASSARAAVIACVDSDAENIFITLTARELRPDIAIVARAGRRALREQAAARGRRPRDLALQDRRARRWRAWPCTRRCPAWSTCARDTAWRRSR